MPDELETYGQRLASAMEEAGFPARGGQSKLAKSIGCTSQTVNQALKGLTLGAIYHVRASIRLGIRPLWLAEGRGQRYDPAGPRVAVPGEEPPYSVPEAWAAGFAAEQGARINDAQDSSFNLSEQALIHKLRASTRLSDAITALVDMADVSKG